MFESLYKQSEAVCAWGESVLHAAVDVLAGSCEHISLTQKKLCRGTAYLTVCWPGWASAHAHQQLTDWLTSDLTYWLRAEEPWEPKAPVRADCDSLSGRRKRRMLYSPRGGKKYTHTHCKSKIWLTGIPPWDLFKSCSEHVWTCVLGIDWKQKLTFTQVLF